MDYTYIGAASGRTSALFGSGLVALALACGTGCSGPASTSDAAENADLQAVSGHRPAGATPVDARRSLLGHHVTQWQESIGDEGPIPYSALDLHADGTFNAVTYDQNQGPGVSPTPGYPSVSVTGRWVFVPSNALPSSRQPAGALHLEEDAPRAWSDLHDMNAPAVIQKFDVDVREPTATSYRLCWFVAFYECPKYELVSDGQSSGSSGGSSGSAWPFPMMPGPALTVIPLEYQDNGKTIPVRMGQEINIHLESNVTTGYDWVLASDDSPLGAPRVSHESAGGGLVGAPGSTDFRFTTTGTSIPTGSKFTLQFEYKRPWEKSTPPAKTFAVTLSF